MASVSVLSFLFRILLKLRKGVFRVLTLAVFGGKWTYLGVTFFFLLPHFQAASGVTGLEAQVLAVLESAGIGLATSWQDLLHASSAASTASGFRYWHFLDKLVFALVDILWFYRTTELVLLSSFGSDAPVLGRLIVFTFAFNVLAFSVTGRIPFFELAELLESLPGVLDYGRGFDFFNNTVNGSVSGLTGNVSGFNETFKNVSR